MVVSRIRSDRIVCVVDSSLYGMLPRYFDLDMTIRREVSNRGITSIASSSYTNLSYTAQYIIILEQRVNCEVRNKTVLI